MKDKKVVKVPHFVAEWIDYKIGNEGLEGVLDFVWAVHGVMTYEYTGKRETSTDLAWWLFGYNSNTHSEILLDAWLNGCEVKPNDQRYYLAIPDDRYLVRLYERDDEGNIHGSSTLLWNWEERIQQFREPEFMLTEEEIRKDFDWAWKLGFCKEVKNER